MLGAYPVQLGPSKLMQASMCSVPVLTSDPSRQRGGPGLERTIPIGIEKGMGPRL